MTAWAKLTEGSTLSSGTAWQHLNAQEGGGQTVYVEWMTANLVGTVLAASLSADALTANIADEALGANITVEVLIGAVAQIELSAQLSSMGLAGSITQMILSANLEEAPI